MRTKPIPYTQVSLDADVVIDAISGTEDRDDRPYCPEHGLMAQGADCWYCEACEHRLLPEEVVEAVLQAYENNSERWRERDDDYWLKRLMQEVGELASSLTGDHDDPPEHELVQIASISINWLLKRAEAQQKEA